jgi:predicted Rossmann fold nucleotide-binding protein DprA/Smf involved in DNA uptake
MILGITGTRLNDDWKLVYDTLEARFPKGEGIDLLISGNAIGVDRNCEMWAKSRNIPVKIIKPDYKKYADNPKYAPIARNLIIAAECDILVAFPLEDGSSKGTQSTIDEAKRLGKTVYIVPISQK